MDTINEMQSGRSWVGREWKKRIERDCDEQGKRNIRD